MDRISQTPRASYRSCYRTSQPPDLVRGIESKGKRLSLLQADKNDRFERAKILCLDYRKYVTPDEPNSAPTPKAAYCAQCGSKRRAEATFCENCGAQVGIIPIESDKQFDELVGRVPSLIDELNEEEPKRPSRKRKWLIGLAIYALLSVGYLLFQDKITTVCNEPVMRAPAIDSLTNNDFFFKLKLVYRIPLEDSNGLRSLCAVTDDIYYATKDEPEGSTTFFISGVAASSDAEFAMYKRIDELKN